jgi:hypothetical protein
MPFKYDPYESTYVDPQSVKISETLRNRFMQNLQANDALAMAVDQMQAALPFENDVQKKKELQMKLDETINTMAEQGSYELMGDKIRLATMDFSKKYAPIKENFDRYQAALTDLDKRYKAKEIDAEQYASAGSYITRGYKGFELDEQTGRVKEGSMFSAPTIYNDPGISDRIIKALSIIKPDKYDNKNNKLAVGPDGMYTVTNERGVEQVLPEDIKTAYDYVMSDPNVRMFVDQKADMKAYNIERQGAMPTAIQGTIDQYNKLIEKYTTDMNTQKLTSGQKSQYQETINAMKSEVVKATQASVDPTLSYNYLKSRLAEEMMAPAKDWAMLAAYKNTSSSTIYDYDPIWKGMREQAMKEADAGMPMYSQTEAKAIDHGGATVGEKTNTIVGLNQRNRDIDKELEGNLDKDAKDRLLKEKRNNEAEINMQKYHIAKAREMAAGSVKLSDMESVDPKIMQVFKDMMPGKNAQQIYAEMERTFDNTQDQDYANFVAEFDSRFGNGAFVKHRSDMYGPSPTYNAGAGSSLTMGTSNLQYGSSGESIMGRFRDNLDINNNANEALKEIKVSSVFNYGTIQAGTPKESIALTKALDDLLVGKPINSVTMPTAYDLTAGTKVSDTSILANYTVKDYGFDEKTNTFELLLENKESLTQPFKKIHVSGEYLSANIPLLNKVTEPTSQLGAVIMRERPLGGTADAPEIYTRPIWITKTVNDNVTGQVINTEVSGWLTMRSTGSGTPTISLSNVNGEPIFVDENGEPSTTFRNPDDKDIQTIVKTGLIKF